MMIGEDCHLMSSTTLDPGDVIVTGTLAGAGARFDPPRYRGRGHRPLAQRRDR
jgi:2-keto-4-pentenoate hydratase/2-oxohepta-3-ene-1,7-dioic acid hydratase in catechol pathway